MAWRNGRAIAKHPLSISRDGRYRTRTDHPLRFSSCPDAIPPAVAGPAALSGPTWARPAAGRTPKPARTGTGWSGPCRVRRPRRPTGARGAITRSGRARRIWWCGPRTRPAAWPTGGTGIGRAGRRALGDVRTGVVDGRCRRASFEPVRRWTCAPAIVYAHGPGSIEAACRRRLSAAGGCVPQAGPYAPGSHVRRAAVRDGRPCAPGGRARRVAVCDGRPCATGGRVQRMVERAGQRRATDGRARTRTARRR